MPGCGSLPLRGREPVSVAVMEGGICLIPKSAEFVEPLDPFTGQYGRRDRRSAIVTTCHPKPGPMVVIRLARRHVGVEQRLARFHSNLRSAAGPKAAVWSRAFAHAAPMRGPPRHATRGSSSVTPRVRHVPTASDPRAPARVDLLEVDQLHRHRPGEIIWWLPMLAGRSESAGAPSWSAWFVVAAEGGSLRAIAP
jgi:hypothetical protein